MLWECRRSRGSIDQGSFLYMTSVKVMGPITTKTNLYRYFPNVTWNDSLCAEPQLNLWPHGLVVLKPCTRCSPTCSLSHCRIEYHATRVKFVAATCVPCFLVSNDKLHLTISAIAALQSLLMKLPKKLRVPIISMNRAGSLILLAKLSLSMPRQRKTGACTTLRASPGVRFFLKARFLWNAPSVPPPPKLCIVVCHAVNAGYVALYVEVLHAIVALV